MLFGALIILHYYFISHLLKVLFKHLDVSNFLIDIVSLDEDNVSEFII